MISLFLSSFIFCGLKNKRSQLFIILTPTHVFQLFPSLRDIYPTPGFIGCKLEMAVQKQFCTNAQPMYECAVWLGVQSCTNLCDPMVCSLSVSSVHRDSPGKNTGVGCHALLSGKVKRANQTLKRALAKLCQETHNKLIHMLPIALMRVRAAPQMTTIIKSL